MDLDEDLKGSTLMLPDSSLKRGWRKQKDELSLDADDTKCGLGSCKPSALQCCGTIGGFTAVYCMSGLISAALQVYLASQITALERHFGFSSSITGFLVSANEIGFLSVTIIFSYVVRKLHIPRLLSVTTILYGLSGLMCVIPFILTRDQLAPPSNSNTTSVFHTGPLCNTLTPTRMANASQVCEETKFSYVQDTGMRKIAVAIIGAGMILQGIAKAPRISAITTYIDDNVPKTKSPMYLGIIFGVVMCSAAMAFGLGGLFSKIFVTLEVTPMTPMHPRWLGAWWLGFFVFGLAALFVAIPLVCFPRRMATADDRNVMYAKKRLGISGFLSTIARLLSNPVFCPVVVGNCITFLSLGGIMAFMPKYMETQFTVPSWQSNMVLGAVGIGTNFIGTIVGGMLTSKLKLSPLTCLKIGVGAIILSMVLQGGLVILGCPNPVISKGGPVVVNVTSTNRIYGYLTPPPTGCNSDCGCTDKTYFPMCGADGVNYFNPCFAGCSEYNHTMHTYSECLCVAGEDKIATPGLCPSKCPFFLPFLGLALFGGFIMTMTTMPMLIAIMRSVSEEDKPVSIGLNSFLSTLLGLLPGPILFGWLIDGACIHWNTGCDDKGSCALYDIEKFRYLVMGIPAVTRVVTLFLYIVALCMAYRPNSFYRKYEQEQGTKDEKLRMNSESRL